MDLASDLGYHQPMDFVLSKVLWELADFEGVILAALVAGVGLLWLRWHRAARWLLTLTALATFVLSVLPVGYWLLAELENRFPAMGEMPERIDGIIVLGGAISPGLSRARGQPQVGGDAERLFAAIELANRYPKARVLFTGGSASLTNQALKEAPVAAQILHGLGLAPERLTLEARSRNTYENAIYSYEIAKPQAAETWLLVTSARHMPRAMGTFRAAGWPVTAYPAGYHTDPDWHTRLDWGFAGLSRLRTALKEWLGLVVYRLLGRCDSLFPGPEVR